MLQSIEFDLAAVLEHVHQIEHQCELEIVRLGWLLGGSDLVALSSTSATSSTVRVMTSFASLTTLAATRLVFDEVASSTGGHH
jgi:hypothetical protein